MNDAPSGNDNTVTTLEDSDYTFTAADFGFTDPVEGDSFNRVRITNLPTVGTLFLDANGDGVVDGGEAVVDDQFINIADINAGRLKFKPVTGGNGIGYDSFTFAVEDDGGTTDGGVNLDPTPNTITIDVTEAYRIEGNIFEDVNGDSNLADAVGVDGVTVYLYDNTGTLIQTDLTSGGGFYSFASLVNGDYSIVVDSTTIAPSAGLNGGYTQVDVWAEQTYGVAGAQVADGSGGTTTLVTSGAAFGGKLGDVSDNAAALATSEHVTTVTVNSGDVANIDSGYSFNVVTGISDSGQGSLRQFVGNAEAISGGNTMRFVPVVATNTTDGGGNDWWTIGLSSAIGGMNDAQTVIDGTAYSRTDGVSALDTNAGQIGSGGTVGLGADGVIGTGDDVAISQFNRTELEIVGAANATRVLVFDGDDAELHDVAIRKLSDGTTTSAIVAFTGSDVVMTGAMIGVSADGTQYGVTGTNGAFATFSGATGATVTNNYIGYGGSAVVTALSLSNSTDAIVTGNEIDGAFRFGLSAYSDNMVVSGNLVDGVTSGFGIGTFYGPRTGVTIENNTVRNTTGYAAIAAGFGSIDTTIRYNVVHDNTNAIIVRNDAAPHDDAQNAVISMNSVYNNASIGIDNDDTGANDGLLVATEANDGIDHPIITSASLVDNQLSLSGYVGAAPDDTDFAGARIEFFVADPSGEGQTYLGFLTTDANGNFQGDLTVTGVTSASEITATATLTGVGTSEFGNAFGFQTVSGTIFEDMTGDGLNGGSIGDADNVGVAGVTVSVYQDGGDGIADGVDDIYVGETTTLVGGTYSFAADGGSFWVVVDSRTIVASAGLNGGYVNADTWADQTYGAAGALAADGSGGTKTLGSAGTAFGGRLGDVSDNAAALATAEHVTGINVSGSDVSDIDSGFSFNVATGVADSGQGSLRQFIDNANAIVGDNSLRFVPIVSANSTGASGDWWTVTLASELAVLSDDGTTIDGTAIDFSDGVSVRNTNTGDVNASRTVGVDGLTLDAVERQELEIFGNGVAEGIVIDADSVTVSDLAIYGIDRVTASTGTQIQITTNVDSASGEATISRTVLGARADGSDPGATSGWAAILANGAATISNNYIAYTNASGVRLNGLAGGNSDAGDI